MGTEQGNTVSADGGELGSSLQSQHYSHQHDMIGNALSKQDSSLDQYNHTSVYNQMVCIRFPSKNVKLIFPFSAVLCVF